MTNPSLLCLNQAQITRDSSGLVVIDDPGSPLLVKVRIDQTRSPQQIVELTIQARHPTARITSAALGRLPLAQIKAVAAWVGAHPNDTMWRTRIAQKPAGSRSWPDSHWEQVLNVYRWAQETRRPGGGAQAIADMWSVSRNPTAYRWLAHARETQSLHLDTS